MEFHTTDELFTRLPTKDIRVALRETQKDAVDKENELRALVGTRYHNLLDSVDDAVRMHDTVQRLEALLQHLSRRAQDVEHNVAQLTAAAGGEGGTSAVAVGDGNGAVAAKAFLQDVVEVMWSHCDAGRLHDAMAALFASRVLCQRLPSSADSRFVRDTLASLAHFPRHLVRCAETVARVAGDTPRLASALATWVVLSHGAGGEPVSMAAALDTVLSHRATAVFAALADVRPEGAHDALVAVAAAVAGTLSDVEALFGADGAVFGLVADTLPATVRVVGDVPGAGHLVGDDAGVEATLAALGLWEAGRADGGGMAEAASATVDAWFDRVHDWAQDAVPACLQHVASPEDLVNVRSGVVAACSPRVWSAVFQPHVASRASDLLFASFDATTDSVLAEVDDHLEALRGDSLQPSGALAAAVVSALANRMGATFGHMAQLLDAGSGSQVPKGLLDGCVAALGRMVTALRERAATVAAAVPLTPSRAQGEGAAAAAGACLFVGRLAGLLAAATLTPVDCGAAMAPLVEALTGTATQCAAVWSRWVGAMVHGVASDHLGTVPPAFDNWVHTHPVATVSVSVEDETDAEAATDTFSVPCSPSPAAASSLTAFASAFASAGLDGDSGACATAATAMGQQQGLVGLLAAYAAHAAVWPEDAPDVARMQLLFDLAVAQSSVHQPAPLHPVASHVELLVGSPPPPLASPGYDTLWATLEAPMDVVDWQMAKEYFEALVRDAVAGCELLLTPLAPAGLPPRPHAAVDAVGGATTLPVNTLPMLPAVGRLALLPVPTRSADRRPSATAFASLLHASGKSAGGEARSSAASKTSFLSQNTDALKSKALSLMGQVGASGWFSSASSFLSRDDVGDVTAALL